MLLKYIFLTAVHALLRNTGRSLLTILGIVIGITAIMVVLSVGQSGKELILNQVRGLGAQTVLLEPGREPQGPSDYVEMFTDSLRDREVAALKRKTNVQGIKLLAPSVMQMATISIGNESLRRNAIGSSQEIAAILELNLALGSFFSNEDVRQKASVTIIGSHIKEDLFGESDALGEKIKIKGKTFRVIGILKEKGQTAFLDIDKIAFVPYTTAQEYLFGINYFNFIMMRAESDEIVDRAVRDIKLTMRELHAIDDPDKDDFHVMTQADIAERVGMITTILTALLVSVAAISLVVGGVGIMNIMLVSVSERTREIGLRKALGARDQDILRQFLFESVILTGVGGIIGVIGGALLSLLAGIILTKVVGVDWQFIFPFMATVLGLVVSAAVGLVFGLYPARQAAKKSPIEALRYE